FWSRLTHNARHAQKSAEADAAAAHGLAAQRIIRKPLQKSRDRDRAFEPGQRHPCALVRAGGEGEMPVGVAADIEPFGIGKLRGIAVGSTYAQRHRRARFKRDAAKLEALCGYAV